MSVRKLKSDTNLFTNNIWHGRNKFHGRSETQNSLKYFTQHSKALGKIKLSAMLVHSLYNTFCVILQSLVSDSNLLSF